MSRARWSHSTTFVLALMGIAGLCSGCEEKKREAGKVCPLQDNAKWTCADAASALYCQAGKYVAIPCRGAKGCTGKPADAVCDTSVGRVGDACIASGESGYSGGPATCTEDKKS